ncbi:MAG: DUF1957 domain-containing protein [Candidatus Kapabacteria bacterium]|nr:DUF1957 domain-containing protein [Candidatus Kapabacteria bacterium]
MHVGNYVLILHTHLPYVLNHGDWPHGSDWVCEAVAECYIPLLNAFHQLKDEGISPKVTLDISPVLCEQLAHPDFPALFEKYCQVRIDMAKNDEKYFKRTEQEPQFQRVAKYWQEWYSKRKTEYVAKYNRSIIGALKELQDSGDIEVMTCGATHGYFALLGSDKSIRLQLNAAIANYQKHFGRKPRGVWLPECAYRPAYPWKTYLPVAHLQKPTVRAGVEQLVHEAGLEYFVVDQGTTLGSKPVGVFKNGDHSTFVKTKTRTAEHPFDKTPLALYNVASGDDVSKGTSVIFTRDQNIAMQVWSGDLGYPGDPMYLDFHKKHHGSALRYWRVTDNKADMMYKLLYVPQWAQERVNMHAFHFTQSIERSLLNNHRVTNRFATLCNPFDTELFGHWWFEGPQFVQQVLRGLHHSPYVQCVTASEQLDAVQPNEVISIPESSWGKNGHHEVWMNPDVQYMWEAIYKAEKTMDDMVTQHVTPRMNKTLRRILTQAMRELMLLQASDWEFLVSTFSAKDYAEMRFFYHHSDFVRLCGLATTYAKKKKLTTQEKQYLELVEQRNAIFSELKLEMWC